MRAQGLDRGGAVGRWDESEQRSGIPVRKQVHPSMCWVVSECRGKE